MTISFVHLATLPYDSQVALYKMYLPALERDLQSAVEPCLEEEFSEDNFSRGMKERRLVSDQGHFCVCVVL